MRFQINDLLMMIGEDNDGCKKKMIFGEIGGEAGLENKGELNNYGKQKDSESGDRGLGKSRIILQRKTSKLREGDTISNLVDPFLSEAVQSEWKIHAKEESRAGEKELCKQLWTKY